MIRTQSCVVLAAAMAIAGLVEKASATVYIWQHNALGSNDWSTNGNWDVSGFPTTGDTAIFPSVAGIGKLPNVYGAINAEALSFDNTNDDWSLVFNTGAALTLGANGTGGITAIGGGTAIIGPGTNLAGNQTWDVATNTTVQFQRNFVTGKGNIVKNGAGTVIVINNAGGAGRVPDISNPTSTTINGGTIKMTGSGASLGGTSGSQVPVFVNDTGTLDLGGVSVSQAKIKLNDGSTLKLSANGNQLSGTGVLQPLDAGAKITVNTGSVGDSVQVSNTGFTVGSSTSTVTVTGSGKLQLTGSGAGYLGTWKITGGTVQVDNNDGFGSAATAKVETSGGSKTIFNGGSNNGSFTVSIPVTVKGDSTLAIDRLNSASNTGSITRTIGALTLESGTVSTGIGSFIRRVQTSTAALITPSLTLTGSGVGINTPVLTDPDPDPVTPLPITTELRVTGGITDGVTSYGFTKSGGGLMRVQGAGTYEGSTTVLGGILEFNSLTGLGTTSAISVAGGAQLKLAAGGTNNYTFKSDVSGGGTILSTGGAGAGSNTLTLQGSSISPGASPGILSIGGNLALAKDGSEFSALNIEIDSGNGGAAPVAGTHFDRLAVTGTLAGLANTNLVVDIDPSVVLADLAGDTLVIATFATSSAGTFDNLVSNVVTFTDPNWSALVTVDSTTVSLSQFQYVPEPASLSLLGLAGLFLGRRRVR